MGEDTQQKNSEEADAELIAQIVRRSDEVREGKVIPLTMEPRPNYWLNRRSS